MRVTHVLNAEGRSPGVEEAAHAFDYGHLTQPDQVQIAVSHARLAQELLGRIRTDSPELVAALKALEYSRDRFIEAIRQPS